MQFATTRIRLVVGSALSLLSVACSGGGAGTPTSDTTPLEPPVANVVTRTSVADMLGTTEIAPIGLTITPDTNQLVLLDARQGVYVLGDDRRFRRVAEASRLYADASPDSDFTDIAALGSDRFAITARNDGFLLDLADGSMRQHFCYVPGFLFPPDPDPTDPPGPVDPPVIEQLTDSVAFDTSTGRILAQPITMVDDQITQAEVGTFPITGGEGDDWHPIGDRQFLAGGMTVDADGVVWLGRGTDLCRYDLNTDALDLEQSLSRFDIQEITGMVFDGDDLMVLDGPSATIVRIPASLR